MSKTGPAAAALSQQQQQVTCLAAHQAISHHRQGLSRPVKDAAEPNQWLRDAWALLCGIHWLDVMPPAGISQPLPGHFQNC